MLNDKLYRQLEKRFGTVKVSNAGNRRLERRVADPLVPGRSIFQKIDPGEQYRVCCPKCSDTHYHLYISYRWNTMDGNKIYGRDLVHCFRCGSMTGPEFEVILSSYLRYRPVIVRKASEAMNITAKPLQTVEFPGKCVSILDLDKTHPAIQYLTDRKFDVAELGKEWQLRYCEDYTHHLVRHRIVIPILWQGKMIGWQARAVERRSAGCLEYLNGSGLWVKALPDKKGKPKIPIKYFTMPGLNKSSVLFNGDRAKTYPFGVVVEGVMDAFRVGPRAVALLGKTVSYQQHQLLQAWWGHGAVCLMLDPDAIEDMDRLMELLGKRKYRWGAFKVELPDGKDPDEFSRERVWALIAARARQENVTLVGPELEAARGSA